MSVIAAALRELIAAGVTGDQLVMAIERIERAAAPQRSKHAEAQARYRENKKNKSSQVITRDHGDHTDHDTSLLDDKDPHTPKNTNPLSKENPPKGGQKKGSGYQAALAHVWPADAWERWYGAYPHKVGKGAAEAAFDKIRRSGRVSFEALMAGLEAYKLTKPSHVDWCNPATWLNQRRWEDAPAVQTAGPSSHAFLRRGLIP
jgi:hypothetical protein